MALRMTTAMSLVLATGILAACNDDDGVPEGTAEVAPEAGAVVTPEGVEMTAETADDPELVENQSEVADMQATAEAHDATEGNRPVYDGENEVLVLEDTVNDEAVDQNVLAPDVAVAAPDEPEAPEVMETDVEIVEIEPAPEETAPEVVETDVVVVDPAVDDGALDGVGADTVGAALDDDEGLVDEDAVPEIAGAAEALTTDLPDESPAEETAELPAPVAEAEREERQIIATDDTALSDGYQDDAAQTGQDIVVADGLVLENQNDPLAEGEYAEVPASNLEALNSTGERDAEARAVPGSGTDVAVEETNDVGTDGIDSGSELLMTNLDDLVLDQEGVERLTSFIENSDAFTATQKITIVAGIDAAKDDPARFDQLMEQIRGIVAAAE